MAEETKIKLVYNPKGNAKDIEQEFSISHAERLLNYQKSKNFTDWEIPAGSGYKFENGNINPTSSPTADPKAGK